MSHTEMSPTEIKVQACGCISLPEEITEALGLGPGSLIRIPVSREQQSSTLVSSSGSQAIGSTERAACQTDPARS